MADLSPEQLAALYTADPDEFLTVRSSLAAEAKRSGDPDLAREIGAQRKPTIAAWIVNKQVHTDPSTVHRLVELGSRLRAAHEQLDAPLLRELSTERRQLITVVGTAALAGAERTDSGATLRDDVSDTFDAAVADPQIAARLGRLTRGEKWSGFGVAMDAPPGAPELTVIRGGRDRAATKKTKSKQTIKNKQTIKGKQTADQADQEPASERHRRRTREAARDRAAEALIAADAELQDGTDAERSAAERVRDLGAELERTQREMATAKRDLDRSRQQLRSARNRRREARTALTRAERQLDAPE